MAEKEGLKVFPVSAATKEGLQDLMRYVYQMLQDYVEEVDEEDNVHICTARGKLKNNNQV